MIRRKRKKDLAEEIAERNESGEFLNNPPDIIWYAPNLWGLPTTAPDRIEQIKRTKDKKDISIQE